MTTKYLDGKPTTHEAIIREEKAKFTADWIVLTELFYGKYKFDIFAFNPKTKKIQIVEVDLTSPTAPEKISFIESFAELKIIKLNRIKSKFLKTKSFKPILKVISNKIRVMILDYLNDEGSKTYTEIMQSVKMDPTKDAGRFGYHFGLLKKAELIELDNKVYSITEKGHEILKFVE